MSHKPDKAARRKAKLKAKRVHAEQLRHQQHVRIAAALTDLCADVLPKYVDDSKGPDLVGRNILWRMGMVAWNVAITGRKEIDDSSIDEMRVDAESKKMVRDEINGLVRRKYEKYPELRTAITDVAAVAVAGGAKLKVSLGDTFPAMPIPDFNDRTVPLTPEQILTKRKGLKLSQVKFAAALGVSVKKVSAWEHGKAKPTAEELEKIKSYTPKRSDTMSNKEIKPHSIDLDTFMNKRIVILDTCTCRALISPEESPWLDTFGEMKHDGVEFCISDVAGVELLNQFNNGGILPRDWEMMIDKLNTFVSDYLPIFPGEHQLFQMASIADIEYPTEKLNFSWELAYSQAGFDLLKRCKTRNDLKRMGFILKNPNELFQKYVIQVDKIDHILREQRLHWIQYATKNSDELQKKYKNPSVRNSNSGNLNAKKLASRLQEEITNVLFEEMRNEIKKHIMCEPDITIRAELLLKYLATIVARSAKTKEPYNPTSSKRKNDGIDFLFLLGLVLPARICSKDSLKIIKGLDSFQSNWIQTPDEIAIQWRDDMLTKLSWPSNKC